VRKDARIPTLRSGYALAFQRRPDGNKVAGRHLDAIESGTTAVGADLQTPAIALRKLFNKGSTDDAVRAFGKLSTTRATASVCGWMSFRSEYSPLGQRGKRLPSPGQSCPAAGCGLSIRRQDC
jgi:hypothetical protein